MDGSEGIGRNLAALKRIVASVVVMIGGREFLPRRFRLAVMQMLRPAESAARRLIIAAAKDLAVELKPSVPRSFPRGRTSHAAAPARRRRFALTDRLPRIGPRGRSVPPHAAPRITSPGLTRRFELPLPPSPNDPIDSRAISGRIAALTDALDDLPGEAMRFARWQAIRAAAAARRLAGAERCETNRGGKRGTSRPPWRKPAGPPPRRRFIRTWPLRAGRPPGGRLSRYDPDGPRGSRIREIDEILAHCHALAMHALDARAALKSGKAAIPSCPGSRPTPPAYVPRALAAGDHSARASRS